MLEDPAKREQVADEVADVFFFILRFAQMYGLDLASEFQRKMAKNAARYPVSTSKGSNAKYTEK